MTEFYNTENCKLGLIGRYSTGSFIINTFFNVNVY